MGEATASLIADANTGAASRKEPRSEQKEVEAEQGEWRNMPAVTKLTQDLCGYEVDNVTICGLELRVLRRRSDYYAACAGDLPILSTGLVLWECGPLLADYLGYARWKDAETDDSPWWQLHPPAAVVPLQFWTGRRVLELGGGCGMVAIVLACFGAQVVCTDGDEAALRTAERNAGLARLKYAKEWGSIKFQHLGWGDAEPAQSLARDHGPFDFIVGSDLLYGDKAPPEPLVETLAALASSPESRGAEVILALKNRCLDEASAFCNLARERGHWEVRLASAEDLLEGYDGKSCYGGDGPAYNVVHLKVKPGPLAANDGEGQAAPAAKRARLGAGAEELPGEDPGPTPPPPARGGKLASTAI